MNWKLNIWAKILSMRWKGLKLILEKKEKKLKNSERECTHQPFIKALWLCIVPQWGLWLLVTSFLPWDPVPWVPARWDTCSATFRSLFLTHGQSALSSSKLSKYRQLPQLPFLRNSLPLGAALGNPCLQAPPDQRGTPVHTSKSPHGKLSQTLSHVLLQQPSGSWG